MEDHTMISMVAIAAGVVTLVAGLAFNDLGEVLPLAGLLMGTGVGSQIGGTVASKQSSVEAK